MPSSSHIVCEKGKLKLACTTLGEDKNLSAFPNRIYEIHFVFLSSLKYRFVGYKRLPGYVGAKM